MKISVFQVNSRVGDVLFNKKVICESIEKANTEGAELIIFGEMVLSGSPAHDLLCSPEFLSECYAALKEIAKCSINTDILLGLPLKEDGKVFNTIVHLSCCEIKKVIYKNRIISTDEKSYFSVNRDGFYRNFIECKGQKILIVAGEDISYIHTLPYADIVEKEINYIIHIAAKPYIKGIIDREINNLKSRAKLLNANLISVNLVGGCTNIIYYGSSLIINKNGTVVARLKDFEEDHLTFDLEVADRKYPVTRRADGIVEEMYKAVSLGLKDYCRKAGFSSVCIGLSGGIDSAVVAAIAADTLGCENVHALMMPSQFSSDHSIYDAVELSLNLGIKCEKIEIEPMYHSFMKALEPVFECRPFSVAEENLQARIRGVLLMALSNKIGGLVLNTSNKSEAAVGYGTLYGDTIGGLSLLGDIYKTDVYALAGYINRKKEIIPQNILEKAPSAELCPGQKDSDSLPAYELLDKILLGLIEERKTGDILINEGHERKS